MKNIRIFLAVCLVVLLAVPVFSQNNLGNLTGDESTLYAQTKQVNQFFRRFNNEEDRYGNRYYPGDSLYRDTTFRKTYLNMVFDNQSPFIDKDLKKEFIERVSDKDHPVYLEFHGGNWFAEVPATFTYYGNKENLLLFLELEDENLGSKWVLTNVYFDKFLKMFYKGEHDIIKKSFLHPMSHELDFMDIYKVFRDNKYVEYYASKSFKPDYLTLLFYEVKRGNMVYQSVGPIKFHFFQVDGWYFELSYVNRSGYNSGWLITKLYRIDPQEKDELIKFYLP